ncbi:AtpZ/AtpI family protein [Paracoccus aerodenitrificans]|uniref:AtpZ/AtpI family protein n=1 Tax=Paracoccus aerodenitrificans TaxID=3017781 RepID=UPI0022F06523|nr:AtpZ/AtpI family protein [Paracoccus aerodenitrificans]WBU63086.1 AtpZ/AtpI family protein [Paracoccus aerodenitrificans]
MPDRDERVDHAERLRQLEERLAKIKAPKPPTRTQITMNHAETAWRMVIELVSGLGIGFAIGFGLDSIFGTMPIFLILFLLVGLAAGIKVMLGTAEEMQRRAAKNTQGDLPQTRDDARGDGNGS